MILREFVCYGDSVQLPKESSCQTKEKAQPRLGWSSWTTFPVKSWEFPSNLLPARCMLTLVSVWKWVHKEVLGPGSKLRFWALECYVRRGVDPRPMTFTSAMVLSQVWGKGFFTVRKMEVMSGVGGRKTTLSDNPVVLPCRVGENWGSWDDKKGVESKASDTSPKV